MRETSNPPWFDPALTGRDDCVVSCLLERHATERGDTLAMLFETGESWTWQQVLDETRATASAFAALGIKRGDKVLSWLPSGPAAIRTWFGANHLGAVFVPINTAYKGRLLEHAMRLSDARLMVAHAELAARLGAIGETQVENVIICAGAAPDLPGYSVLPEEALKGDGHAAPLPADCGPGDAQCIVFTSGTTGPSKGVLSPYLQTATTGRVNYGYMTADDRILINLPFFHVGGITPMMAALCSGASAAVIDGFSTTKFLETVRRTGSTTCAGFVGSMAAFLLAREPRSDDAENPLRMLILSPLNQQAIAAAERFGFDYCSGFNMTEISTPLITEVNSRTHTSLGRPRVGAKCRIIDAAGKDCTPGDIGELLVQTVNRYEMNLGYYNMPEATAEAWRDDWFHTGDLVKCNADGEFFFVDRLKDAIRRRGENISSLEVEAEVYSHPDVGEAAVLGVASPHGEQDVLLAVAAKAGHAITPEDLIEYLIDRLPYFMVPRYVRILERLPRTATDKIQKVALREAGVTADTWDREASGIVIKRERLETQ